MKLVEQHLLFVLGNSDAGIPHGKAQPHLGIGFRDQRHAHDHFAVPRKFHGVADKVQQHLAQPPRISLKVCGHIWRHRANELELLLVRTLGHHFGEIAHQDMEIEIQGVNFQPAGFDLGKIQNIVDHSKQRFGAGVDHFGIVPLVRSRDRS